MCALLAPQGLDNPAASDPVGAAGGPAALGLTSALEAATADSLDTDVAASDPVKAARSSAAQDPSSALEAAADDSLNPDLATLLQLPHEPLQHQLPTRKRNERRPQGLGGGLGESAPKISKSKSKHNRHKARKAYAIARMAAQQGQHQPAELQPSLVAPPPLSAVSNAHPSPGGSSDGTGSMHMGAPEPQRASELGGGGVQQTGVHIPGVQALEVGWRGGGDRGSGPSEAILTSSSRPVRESHSRLPTHHQLHIRPSAHVLAALPPPPAPPPLGSQQAVVIQAVVVQAGAQC